MSAQPNVQKASIFMMLMLLLSRVLGLVRDSVMAAQFGRGDITDAYILAFQLPELLFFLIAGGALSSSFIPVFSEYLHTDREDEAWHVFSAVTTLMASALLVAIGIASWQSDAIVALMNDDRKEHLFPLVSYMSRILLPAQFAFFLGGLIFGTMYAKQRFALPGLGPNLYNIGIIFGAVVLSQYFQPGVIGMAWGAVVGAVTGNLILPIWFMSRLGGAKYHITFDTKHPGVRKVFKLMMPVVFGLSLPGVYAMIMRYFGSRYGEGIVTSLDLSNKLMQAPLGVLGQSFALAVFPALSQFFAQKRMDMFEDQLIRTLRTTLYVSIPVSAILAVFGSDVVAFLYQRGQFTAADGKSVAECLLLFCIGIPAWCLHPILMRAYFSMQNTLKPIVIGTITTFVFVGIALSLEVTPLGHRALPVASSVAAIGLVLAMLIALRKELPTLALNSLLETVWKCVAGSAALALVCWVALQIPIAQLSGESRNLLGFARLAVFGLAGMWAYYFVTKGLGMAESKTLERAAARLARKKAS